LPGEKKITPRRKERTRRHRGSGPRHQLRKRKGGSGVLGEKGAYARGRETCERKKRVVPQVLERANFRQKKQRKAKTPKKNETKGKVPTKKQLRDTAARRKEKKEVNRNKPTTRPLRDEREKLRTEGGKKRSPRTSNRRLTG